MKFKLKIINKIIKKNDKRKSKIKEKWYFNDIFVKDDNKIKIWRISLYKSIYLFKSWNCFFKNVNFEKVFHNLILYLAIFWVALKKFLCYEIKKICMLIKRWVFKIYYIKINVINVYF